MRDDDDLRAVREARRTIGWVVIGMILGVVLALIIRKTLGMG